ncbi:MAG: TatD family hydrolase [Halioglobus sp.]|nr:TatD family hydrolase [Halioglobus sp.]
MNSKKKRAEIPRFTTPIVETHCHLDYLKAQALPETLARAEQAGVSRIVTIAVSPDNLQRVRELAATHSKVWGTQGIHPHEAASYDAAVAQAVREGMQADCIVAVGEIGLDYYYEHADRHTQRQVFEAQLALAAELDMPVVIHTREADDDTRDILRNYSGTLARKGVIHSFTSSLALAEFCLGEGFSLGFNGIATFNRADNVREVVRATPVDRLLLETDAPYLTPVPYRGKENAPCYLPFIAQCVAQVKGLEAEDLLAHAYRNSMALFFNDTVN